MGLENHWPPEVEIAIKEERCFLVNIGSLTIWDIDGTAIDKERFVDWVNSAPDIVVRTVLLSLPGVPEHALIFNDAFYAKLAALQWGLALARWN